MRRLNIQIELKGEQTHHNFFNCDKLSYGPETFSFAEHHQDEDKMVVHHTYPWVNVLHLMVWEDVT